MANPVKGEALLRLADGRQFTLVLDFEAMVAAEAAYGKPLPQLMVDAQAGFMGALRALLAGMFSAHHPGVGKREAGEMLLSDVEAVSEALARAVENAHPAPGAEDKQPGNAPVPQSRQRTKPSGRSGAKRG